MKNYKHMEFTDKNYLSKIEVMEQLGHDNFNEAIWQQIIEYRSTFAKIVKIENNRKEWSYITLTPEIILNESKALAELGILQSEIYQRVMSAADHRIKIQDIKNKNIINQITIIMNKKGIVINRSTISDIILGSKEPEDANEELSFRIYKTLREIETNNYSPKKINEKITNIIGGGLRTTNINFVNEQGINELIGFDKSDINSINKNIELINNDLNMMPLLKGSIIYYAINNGILFDKERELTSIISIYSILSKFGFKDVIGLLNLIEVINKFEKIFKDAFNNAQKSHGDLTYIYIRLIDMVRQSIRETYKTLDEQVIPSKQNNLSKREQNLSAQEIIRREPEISMKQALFFVNHSDQEKSYTINDFREFNSSSYETSRYSMDNLVKLGFYRKVKVGRKFVYNPGN